MKDLHKNSDFSSYKWLGDLLHSGGRGSCLALPARFGVGLDFKVDGTTSAEGIL